MTRAHLMTAFLGLALACCGMQAAMADQLRIALVISNEEYASLPALERCGVSATAARVALRGKGFKVIERGNLERDEVAQPGQECPPQQVHAAELGRGGWC